MFVDLYSYTATLESRISILEPLLPQAQRAELQVVEALAGSNVIETRVSVLEQVTARAHFAHFDPHRGSAAAPEEKVTGRQGGRNKSGQVIHVECGSVTLLSLVLSIRVMLEILVETTA
jgi:hypothetical protein